MKIGNRQQENSRHKMKLNLTYLHNRNTVELKICCKDNVLL